MSAAESTVLQISISLMIMVFFAYSGGRIHQWYRHSMDRDEAFREGYNHASHALFHLATRARRAPSGLAPEYPNE